MGVKTTQLASAAMTTTPLLLLLLLVCSAGSCRGMRVFFGDDGEVPHIARQRLTQLLSSYNASFSLSCGEGTPGASLFSASDRSQLAAMGSEAYMVRSSSKAQMVAVIGNPWSLAQRRAGSAIANTSLG